MNTKRISRPPTWKGLLCLVFVFGLSSCQSLQEQWQEKRQTQPDKPLAEGSQPKKAEEEESVDSTPVKVVAAQEIPKVGIILGPGGAKSFAHIGVLHELEKARVPIDYIIGMEWGAMVGGIYSMSGKANEVEWKLLKMSNELLPQKGFFDSSRSADEISAKIVPFWKENIGRHQVQRGDVPFACPGMHLRTGRLLWQDSGPLINALSRCVPYPPLYKPHKTWVAGAFALQNAISYLKTKGADVVFFVNVIEGGYNFPPKEIDSYYPASLVWTELTHVYKDNLPGVDEVISVVTNGATLYSVDQKRRLIQLGRSAALSRLPRIVDKYGF